MQVCKSADPEGEMCLYQQDDQQTVDLHYEGDLYKQYYFDKVLNGDM